MGKHGKRTFLMSACLYLLLVLFIGISFSASIDGFDTLPDDVHVIGLLNSVNNLPTPSWVTEEQRIKMNTLQDEFSKISLEKDSKINFMDRINILVEIYRASKAAGESNTIILNKFNTATENYIRQFRVNSSETTASTTALKLPAELTAANPPDDTTSVNGSGNIKLPRAAQGSTTAAVSEARPADTAENTTTTYVLIGVFSVVSVVTLTLLIRSR